MSRICFVIFSFCICLYHFLSFFWTCVVHYYMHCDKMSPVSEHYCHLGQTCPLHTNTYTHTHSEKAESGFHKESPWIINDVGLISHCLSISPSASVQIPHSRQQLERPFIHPVSIKSMLCWQRNWTDKEIKMVHNCYIVQQQSYERQNPICFIVREIAFSEPFKIHLPLASGCFSMAYPSVEATSQFFKPY